MTASAISMQNGRWSAITREAMVSGNILVIDDDPAMSSLLQRRLARHGFAVQVAANGPDGIALARRARPDVVLLDVMLPELDGFDVCRALRSLYSPADVSIIMLTAMSELRDRVLGLEIGADDYITKPFHFAELLARIRVQFRRREPAQPPVLQYGCLSLDTESRTVYCDGQRLDLTPREYDLLEVMLRNPRRVLTRDRIAEQVWGDDSETESNVIDVYIRRLRRKLEIANRTDLIQTVRGVGYMLADLPQPDGVA